MFERLEDLIMRSEEILTLMGEPEVANDSKRLQKLMKEQAEISLKYAGYLDRQEKQLADFRRMESRELPADLDYGGIAGLRLEARQKLGQIRPANLGQASRISGVSPADITALMIHLGNL